MAENEENRAVPKDFLDWLGLTSVPRWAKARLLGSLFGLIIVGFFGIAICAAAAVLIKTIAAVFGAGVEGPNLGAGALIAAILGGPFLIWGTVLKHRALGFQKEGHITDRI